MRCRVTSRICRLAIGRRAGILLSLVVAIGACTREPAQDRQPTNRTSDKTTCAAPNRLVAVRPDSIVVMVISEDTIAAVRDTQRLGWIRTLSGEKIVAPPEATPDSSVYVLTDKHLRALNPSGNVRFRVTNPFSRNGGATRGPWALTLTALPDSGVAVSDGEYKTVKFNRKGQLGWRHSLPHDGNMAGHPVAGPNGSLYIYTAAWLYVIGPDGRERWRVPLKTLRVQ